jgi:hypothetical protein
MEHNRFRQADARICKELVSAAITKNYLSNDRPLHFHSRAGGAGGLACMLGAASKHLTGCQGFLPATNTVRQPKGLSELATPSSG